MAEDDWFRGSGWGDDDRALFAKKIARAREHKWFYRRIKARAIGPAHPGDALALLDECIGGDEEGVGQYHADKAEILLTHRRFAEMFEELDTALDKSGGGVMAHVEMQYVFLVGLYRDEPRYKRAMRILAKWDRKLVALKVLTLGMSFEKSFAAVAGRAMILWEQGKRRQAIKPARAALANAMAKDGPIPGHPELGRVPDLPENLRARLIVIADLWDEAELGPRPDIDSYDFTARPAIR